MAKGPPRHTEGRIAYGASARAAAILVAVVPIASLAAVQGGYFPTTWGWVALPLLWVTGVALVVRPWIRLSQCEPGIRSSRAIAKTMRVVSRSETRCRTVSCGFAALSGAWLGPSPDAAVARLPLGVVPARP